jgi:hypothetical protein
MAHPVSRSDLFAGFLAAALMVVASPALAKKKAPPVVDVPEGEASGEGGLPKSGKSESGPQAGDQERPKPILEEDAAGPESDEKGNVNFVGNRAGKGKIIVNAPAKEKAKVYLEGRYFGTAPRTINGVPPGDYIVEITFPNGKSVTRPVAVSGDEESVIEMGGAADIVAPAEKPMAAEKVEKRLGLAKMVGIGALGLLVVGGGFGIWEYTVQKDYDKKAGAGVNGTADQQALDDMASKGDKLALVANICFVGAAVGLIAAGVIGYPAWKARGKSGGTESPDVAPPLPVSFLLSPGRTLGSVNAGMVYQF